MIEVRQLSKRFGAIVAVDQVSFAVDRGGVVGFLGPNGAGKTTTIRILTCYHPATSGWATVGGHDVFTESMAVRRRIGYLPESAPLYPEMRVREFLQFRGKLRGMAAAQRTKAIERVAERCWLTEFIGRPIGQLSKGMRQRVGLADAIMHEPDVLILDEPTIGLDPAQIRETRKLIQQLGHDHTVLLSSHILSEVEQVCTRAIIIAMGRIVAQGAPQELRSQFSSTGRFSAEIKGPRAEVEKAIRALPAVAKVSTQEADVWLRLSIETKDQQDPREDVFRLVASKGWSLREIRVEGATLEDFFVKVTAEQQQRLRGRQDR
ncbi:MAG TPA: ABC transporter ATP-binding protein [Phycisphaerae bacterium]|nr:ABC transporter ATP-binding protein [Phycisphaerae bacterium]HNU46268.1 ABC transporter ATP-binding protein [Phycisphaerae bacterium]